MSSSNSVIPNKQKPKFSVAISTDRYQKLISDTLGDPDRKKRFVAAISSAVAVNPNLQECDAGSILSGALLGESLNLSPSPQLGQYYLVPYDIALKGPDGKKLWLLDENGKHIVDEKGKWKFLTEKRASFIIGYKGYVQMALRTGKYKDLDVIDIHEGEYLGRDPETAKPRFRFISDDDVRDATPVIGYLAYFELINGFRKSMFWSYKKMLKHADDYSPAFSAEAFEKINRGEISDDDMWKYSSYWYKDFDEMAHKTMLRQLLTKWGELSTELQTAFANDNTISDVGDSSSVPTYTEAADDSIPGVSSPAPAEALPEPVAVAIPDLQPEKVNFADL